MESHFSRYSTWRESRIRFSPYSKYTEKIRWERTGWLVCESYLHAECGDLQYALDSEHPREAHVHVLQRVLVLVALPMELQCIHWQTHGRHRYTYKPIKPRVSRGREILFFFFLLAQPLPSLNRHRRGEGTGGYVLFSYFLLLLLRRNSVHRYMNILVPHNSYHWLNLQAARLICHQKYKHAKRTHKM